LAPFGDSALPEKRREYVGRLNRALSGVLSPESFTLSQSYFVGRIDGVPYEVREVEGRTIDVASDLEPLYPPEESHRGGGTRDATTAEELKQILRDSGPGRRGAMRRLSSRWAALGMADDDIHAVLVELLGEDHTNAAGEDLRVEARRLATSAARKFEPKAAPVPAPEAAAPQPEVPPMATSPEKTPAQPATAASRAVIEVRAGELPRLVMEAQDALLAQDFGIYQRGGQLVRIVQLEATTKLRAVTRVAGSSIIAPVTNEYLMLTLARAAEWQKWNAKEKALRNCDPPTKVVSLLSASSGEWRLPTLTGLIAAPTLRAERCSRPPTTTCRVASTARSRPEPSRRSTRDRHATTR
jgi:hypothetical protein